MSESSRGVLYIANDVEAAGRRFLSHSTLSVGACAVSRNKPTFGIAQARGQVFYAELKPEYIQWEMDAMRVGASQLVCIEALRVADPRYDPAHAAFEPSLVLARLAEVGEEPRDASVRFHEWLATVSAGRRIIGLTNTVFFDGSRMERFMGAKADAPSPYGWSGLDLDSVYRGYTARPDANLRGLGLADVREKPHRADWDAWFLARQASVLLYDTMQW